mgnify:CR=1 FL=1
MAVVSECVRLKMCVSLVTGRESQIRPGEGVPELMKRPRLLAFAKTDPSRPQDLNHEVKPKKSKAPTLPAVG